MKSLVVFSFLSLSSIALWAAPVCHQSWQKMLEPGEDIIGDYIISGSKTDGKYSSIKVKDLDGRNERVMQFAPPVDRLVPIPSNQKIIVTRGKESFLFDLKSSKEQPLPLDLSSSYGYSYSAGNDIITVHGTDNNKRVAIQASTGKFLVTENAGPDQILGDSVITRSISGVVIRSFEDSSSRTEIPLAPGQSYYFSSPDVLAVGTFSSTDSSVAANYIKNGEKWEKAPEKTSAIFSGRLSDGKLVYAKITPKKGRSTNIKFNGTNASDFNFKTEIYDSKGKKKLHQVKDLLTIRNGLVVHSNIQSNPKEEKYYFESEFSKLLKGQKAKVILTRKILGSDFYIDRMKTDWSEIRQGNGKSLLVNSKSKKILEVDGNVTGITESTDGRRLKLNLDDNGATHFSIFDLDDEKEAIKLRNYDIKSDSNFKFFYGYEPGGTQVRLKKVCWQDDLKVVSDDCGCLVKGTDFDSTFKVDRFEENQEIVLQTYCQAPFDAEKWNKLTPPLTKGNLSEKQALVYLKRFQKKGGFDNSYLSTLVAILKSPLMEKQPQQIQNAMQALATYHPETAKLLMSQLNLYGKLNRSVADADNSRCEDSESEKARKGTYESLKARVAKSPSPAVKSDFELIQLFQNELQALPPLQVTQMIDNIAESLSQRAATDQDLTGTFQSRLYYFSKKYAMSLFGKEPKPASDLTIAVRRGEQHPVIISSDKIVDKTRETASGSDFPGDPQRYGFYYQKPTDFSFPSSAAPGTVRNQEITWETASGKKSAKVEMKALHNLSTLVKKEATPPYQVLKADKKLVGMMVIGSNLSSHPSLSDHYISYYQDQGYEFEEAKEVPTIDFMKQQIQTGNLDYLIKEAHSDGDESNLFRASTESTLLQGKKSLPNGTTEIIYLLGPKQGSHETKLISNQDFGEWIRARKEKQPLIYFNTSCGSTRKVISEIGAAHSENLIPYPSGSLVYTFSNSDQSTLKLMMDGFLSEKSYEGIRREMSKSPHFQAGSDRMLFPDDSEYDTQIRSNLKTIWDTKITVRDAAGKILNIDEQIDHD